MSSFESRAASMNQEEIIALLKAHEELLRQVDWFKRQLFGAKSERRTREVDDHQLTLGEVSRSVATEKTAIEVAAHRRHRRDPVATTSDDGDLRFDPSVPVKEIRLTDPGLEGEDLSNYDLVGEKVTCRLTQRPGSFVVLRYVRPVYKKKSDGEFSCPPAPPAVLEKSCADVSLLAGILIDKFVFHLPLYRQHQRLRMAGVHLARSTLTNLVHRTVDLLEPVYAAQLQSILSSEVLLMDETPIKAGRKKRLPPDRGQMQTAYFWPIYGDKDEVGFPFARTRGSAVVREALKEYVGVLVSDGYKVYDKCAEASEGRIVHAQCWAHARRHFVNAESAEPAAVRQVLDRIGALYDAESATRDRSFSPAKILAHRAEQVRPIVEGIFDSLRSAMEEGIWLPTNPFTKAASYALSREKALKVFLEHPNVGLDTNDLERAIRPIAIGRKNWMFCWTEIGAKYVGIIQSLLSTCRIQGIDPYTYLVDVLQRIDTHLAKDVDWLTPRLWKERFATDPLRSEIDRP